MDISELRIMVHRGTDSVTVVLTGELDIAGSPRLSARLKKEQLTSTSCLILDLTRLEFMDGWGLRAIIEADLAAQDSGIDVQIIPGPPVVHRVFKLTGFDARLNFIAPALGTAGA